MSSNETIRYSEAQRVNTDIPAQKMRDQGFTKKENFWERKRVLKDGFEFSGSVDRMIQGYQTSCPYKKLGWEENPERTGFLGDYWRRLLSATTQPTTNTIDNPSTPEDPKSFEDRCWDAIQEFGSHG